MSGARLAHVRELVKNPPTPQTDQERNEFYVIGTEIAERMAADLMRPGADRDLIVAREIFGNSDMIVAGIFARLFEMVPFLKGPVLRGLQ